MGISHPCTDTGIKRSKDGLGLGWMRSIRLHVDMTAHLSSSIQSMLGAKNDNSITATITIFFCDKSSFLELLKTQFNTQKKSIWG